MNAVIIILTGSEKPEKKEIGLIILILKSKIIIGTILSNRNVLNEVEILIVKDNRRYAIALIIIK